MNLGEYLEYYPEMEKLIERYDENTIKLLLNYGFKMIKNMTTFLKLKHFDMPFIDCQIELKDNIITCPNYEIFINIQLSEEKPESLYSGMATALDHRGVRGCFSKGSGGTYINDVSHKKPLKTGKNRFLASI